MNEQVVFLLRMEMPHLPPIRRFQDRHILHSEEHNAFFTLCSQIRLRNDREYNLFFLTGSGKELLPNGDHLLLRLRGLVLLGIGSRRSQSRECD